MIYLLDTNTCIQYLNRRNSAVVRKLTSISPTDVVLCDVVKAELYYGAHKGSRTEGNLALYKEFFGRFVSLPFDGRAAEIYGRLRAQLESLGTPIGGYDMLIASIALANDLILVTHNTREFSRVEGLQLEDWEIEV